MSNQGLISKLIFGDELDYKKEYEEESRRHSETSRQNKIIVNHDVKERQKQRNKVTKGLSKIGLTAKDIELLIELNNRHY